MIDLFDFAARGARAQAAVNEQIARARRTDPHTSHEAADKVTPKVTDIQKVVLHYFKIAGAHGMCDLELEQMCGSRGSTYRTRRTELVDKGYLANTGRTVVMNGRKRIVWAITEEGKKHA